MKILLIFFRYCYLRYFTDKKKEIQKFEYLENENSILDEMKNIFHSFSRATIWWKKIVKK